MNLSRLWGGDALLLFFLTSLHTLKTRCTRSKPRCTLPNIAAHPRTSLNTLQTRCTLLQTLPNPAAHSQSSLHNLQPRFVLSNSLHTLKPLCTLSILTAHSPFSFLNFNKIMKAHAPLPTIGRGPQYILGWKMDLQSINFIRRVGLRTCAPYAE